MTSSSNERLLNPQFLLITFLGFIYFFVFHSYLLLPIRLVDFGATEKVVGFIMGIAGLSTLFFTPAVGHLADKYGNKLFISLGFLILLLSTYPFVYLTEANLYYYILRIFHGISFSLFFISAGAFTTDISPQSRKTQAIGIYGVFTIINYALAPYIGTYVIDSMGFNEFILLLSVLTLFGLFFSLLLSRGKSAINSKSDSPQYSYLECFNKSGVTVSAFALFIMGAAFITTLNFISIYSLESGIKDFQLYFVAYTLAVLFIRIFLGWVPDKFGKANITIPSVLIFAVSIFILSLLGNIKLLILAGILFGIGHGFAYPSIYTIIIESNPKEARAKSFAISSLAFTSGGMLGSFIFGIIASFYGLKFMYVLISLVILIMFLILAANRKIVKV